MSRPKIVLLGDSLTQLSFSAVLGGWGAHLQDVYQRRADVVCRGMSGYNTDWYLKYAQESGIFDMQDATMVTIFFGANDSSDAVLNPHHHVPLDRFKSNLQKLLDLCKLHFGNEVSIVMIGCPPVHHEQRLKYQAERYGSDATGKLERSLELSERYSLAAEQVASENQLPCLNLWKEMQTDKNWARFLNDGLHFSREGNEFVGTMLVKTINDAYPEFAVTACPITGQWANSASKCPSLQQSGPYHDQIDHKDPSAAFETMQAKKEVKDELPN